jgi:ABC-type multidrug transport system ATPase subunit
MLDDIKDNNELVNKLNSNNISMFNMLDNKFIHGQHDVLIEMLDENFKDEMNSNLDVNYRISKHDDILGLVNTLFMYICITVVLYTGNFGNLSDFIVTSTKLLAIVGGISSGVSGFIRKLSDLSVTLGDYLMTDTIEKQIEKQLINQQDKLKFKFEGEFSMTFENIRAELVRKDEKGEVTNTFVLKQTSPIRLSLGNPVSINGTSGSGKSTLLKVMSGLKKPISLDMTIDRYETWTLRALQSERVGLGLQTDYNGNILGICDHIIYCRQDSLSFIKGTLYEIVTGKRRSMILDEEMEYIRKAIELSHIDFANKDEIIHHSSVSGGQRARLTIANVIYNILTQGSQGSQVKNSPYDKSHSTTNKPIIFLDEIDKGLNPQLAIDIYENIIANFSNDHILVVISHFDEVKKLFGWSITIEDGVIGGMVKNTYDDNYL